MSTIGLALRSCVGLDISPELAAVPLTPMRRAATALAALPPDQLVEAVLVAVAMRRTDASSEHDFPEGVESALVIAMRSVLDLPLEEDEAKKAERLGRVALGALLHAASNNDSGVFRELRLYARMLERSSRPCAALVRYLAKSWRPARARKRKPEVSHEEIGRALARDSESGRVTDLAFAFGLVDGDVDHDSRRRAVLQMVTHALER